MVDDEPRNYLAEARKILAGETALLAQKEHLEALGEAHECQLIKIVNDLHDIKMRLLTCGP